MLLYAFASSRFDTLLFHASAVEHDGCAYLFLGRSGTGKSTHSRLWTSTVKGAELLNDDNPIVRLKDGKVYVYGSPWSGKTRCYLNRRVIAGAIVRIRQAPYNDIDRLAGVRAYAAVLPSVSYMKWDSDMSEDVHSSVSRLVKEVAVYTLDCLPEPTAAILSCQTIAGCRL